MPDTRSFPPVGDPDRYDQIVRRGRSLRRTRRMAGVAGAGGGAAAVVAAVVLFSGSGSDGPAQIAADGEDTPTTVSTTTTTTTTTTLPPPTELTVGVDASGELIRVEVIDPAAPVGEDARQCVTVSVQGEEFIDTAEATGCDDVPAVDGVVTVELPTTEGTLIDCGAGPIPPDPNAPAEYETESRSTIFELAVPDELPPGEYSAQIGVASGIGDGCAATGDEADLSGPLAPGATERALKETVTFTIG